MATDMSRLTESPGQMKRHPHSGANYYDGEQIISHLNYALGPHMWDFHWMDRGLDADADEVWVIGRLTARMIVDDPNGEGYVTETTVKEEVGWKAVSRKRETAATYQLGDDYKGAATDALKRCARLLGVGLDAWSKDAHQQTPARPAAKPQTPRTATTDEVKNAAKLTGAADPPFHYPNVQERFKAAAEYERLVKVAVETKYQHAEKVQNKRAKDLSDDELEGSIRVLRKWELSQQPSEASA